MAGGEATGHEDWLQREVEESDSAKNIEALTLVLLKKAEEIQKKHPEHKNIKQEYEDVRRATILSLRELQGETAGDLNELKTNLSEDTQLSEGTISEEDFQKIHTEFQELHELDKSQHITVLEETLETTQLTDKYGMMLSLLWEIDVDTNLVDAITQNLADTGKISFKNLQKMKEVAFGEFDVTEIIQDEMDGKIEKGLKEGNILESVKGIGRKEGEELRQYNIALRKGLDTYLTQDKNSQHLEDFLFTYMDDVFPPGVCDRETSLLIEMLRAKFLENKNVDIQDNLGSYYKNQGITEKQLESKSEELRKLGEILKGGDCTLDALGEIQKFNEAHFPDTDFSTTKEDALKIISSVLDYKEADIKVLESEVKREEDPNTKTDLFEQAEDKRLRLNMQKDSYKALSKVDQRGIDTLNELSKLLGRKINTEDAKVLKAILKKPEDRLQEIGSSEQLKTILKDFSREGFYELSESERQSPTGYKIQKVMEGLERTKVSSLQKSALTSETLLLFNGKFDDVSQIEGLLLQNPELIQHVVLQSKSANVLRYLCGIDGGVEVCYIALNTIKSYDAHTSEGTQNFKGSILSQLPTRLKLYIAQQKETNIPVSKEDLEVNIFNKDAFKDLVEDLKNGGTLSIDDKNKMNSFLALIGVENYIPEVTEIIKAGFGNKLSAFRFNEDTLPIGLSLLKNDPTRIRDFPITLRSKSEIIAILLQHSKEYHNYIEIGTIQDALITVKAMRKAGVSITGKMRSKLRIIFDKMTNPEKREFIHNEEKRTLLQGVFDSITEYENGIKTAGEISRNLQTHTVHSKNIIRYLQKNGLNKNQEGDSFIAELLSDGGRLSYENAYRILESQELSPEEIGEHLRNILEITKTQLEKEITGLSGTKLVGNPESFSEIGILNKEGGYELDIELVETSFQKFRDSQEESFSSPSEALEAYITSLKIEGADREKVITLLTKTAELSGTQALLSTKSNTELATLAQQGQLDDYIIAYRKSYFSGENPEDIFQKNQKTRKQEDTAKSLGDEYHTDEDITTILEQGVFTSTEISDLSPEEVHILTGDNEMARENLMNMHETLERLNLEFVWKYRHKYLVAMGNPDIKNDTQGSIDESELLKILNYTLKVIGEESHYSNIDGVENAIKTLNDSQSNALKKNSFGRSDIEQTFWNKGYIDENIGLNITKLQDISLSQ